MQKFIIKAVGLDAFWCVFDTAGEEWGEDRAQARKFGSEADALRFIDTSGFAYEVEVLQA